MTVATSSREPRRERGGSAGGDAFADRSSPRLRLAGRVADPELLDDVVTRLRQIERQAGLERTLAIGELILSQFFGGDPLVWRERRRNKNNSIRRLAARPDCPFSKSALNDAVGVYVAVQAMPSVRTFGHIGSSHVAAVLTLEGPERELLLREAEERRWGVRELRERAVAVRRLAGERRGRPLATEEAQVLAALRACARSLEAASLRLASLHTFTTKGVVELQAALVRAGTALTDMKRQLCPELGGRGLAVTPAVVAPTGGSPAQPAGAGARLRTVEVLAGGQSAVARR